jgi:hypothetical protein
MEATMARRTLIRLLSFTCLAVIGPGHQSQAQPPSNPTSSTKELICETVTDNGGEVICRPVSDKPIKNFGLPQTSEERKEAGKATAEGAYGLHVATNLATVDRTKTWLKGIAGESFARKAAPTVFRAMKSSPARYGTIAVGLFGGGVWLYEKIYGDSESEAKFRLRGILSKDGSLQKVK